MGHDLPPQIWPDLVEEIDANARTRRTGGRGGIPTAHTLTTSLRSAARPWSRRVEEGTQLALHCSGRLQVVMRDTPHPITGDLKNSDPGAIALEIRCRGDEVDDHSLSSSTSSH